jgi:hypothetical protein
MQAMNSIKALCAHPGMMPDEYNPGALRVECS